MINYIIRRLLLSIPTVLGVCLFTFLLFNVFASPEAIARKQLGKNPTDGQVKTWIAAHGMDKPMFFNLSRGKDGHVHPFDSRFWNHMRELVLFQFPESDYLHEKVSDLLKEKIVPSLTITVPAFLLSILVTLPIALFIAYYRGTYLDRMALFVCVILMSIVILNYIILGQYLLAVVFKYFPIYGYDFGIGAWKFLLLPIILAVASGLGGGVRFYRTVMLNEVQGRLRENGHGEGRGRGHDPLQACPQECDDPHPDDHCALHTVPDHREPSSRDVLRHTGYGKHAAQRDQQPRLSDHQDPGLHILPALHCRQHSDGHKLHARRPQGDP